MATEQGIGSILVVDCGTVLTKAVLLDRVDGAYRFVARGEALTTIEPPWQDIALGVQHAIEQIEDITGWVLLDGQHRLITPQKNGIRGVDAMVATSSAARPIRVMLAGLVPELSLASAMRAVSGTYTTVEGFITQDPARGMSEEEQVQLILKHRPDVICIAGGTDGGAVIPVLEMVRTAALASSMMEEKERPRLLFAGNTALRQRVVDIAGGQMEVYSVDNVRPTLDSENPAGVQAEMDDLYQEQHLGALPGVGILNQWSSLPLLPTATAFARIVQYLWYLDESPKGTLGIDLGAAQTTVAAVFGGRLFVTVRGDVGSVYGSQRILAKRGAESIARWVPALITPEEVVGKLLNREMHPGSIPEEVLELRLEQAVAREAIREALQTARPGWRPGSAQPYPRLTPLFDPILVSGGVLSGAPRPGQVALMVLDAVEPIGVSTLLLDTHGLAPGLGAAAGLKPLATVETLDGGGIVNLATTIVPVGTARKGEIVLHVRIRYQDGGTLEVEVPYGSLEALPLPPGQEAVLELRPRARFDVGLGGPGKGGKQRVRGGLAGLIVDARGRPLQLPSTPQERQTQVQQWLWDVGG
ncbi:MAG TPA: hypothetical protein EYP77_11230 [Anaerolineae bacterium]|nr:hypothetical protein [Anaerolineae bacterium]